MRIDFRCNCCVMKTLFTAIMLLDIMDIKKENKIAVVHIQICLLNCCSFLMLLLSISIVIYHWHMNHLTSLLPPSCVGGSNNNFLTRERKLTGQSTHMLSMCPWRGNTGASANINVKKKYSAVSAIWNDNETSFIVIFKLVWPESLRLCKLPPCERLRRQQPSL